MLPRQGRTQRRAPACARAGMHLAERQPQPPLHPPQSMHATLFAVRLRRAAPLHAAFCLAAWRAMRGFSCGVYADPALAAGARLLCEGVRGANALVLDVAGLAPLAGDARAAGACAARPVEVLVPFFCALSCLLTVGAGLRASPQRQVALSLRQPQ